jgi:hypothetical protein
VARPLGVQTKLTNAGEAASPGGALSVVRAGKAHDGHTRTKVYEIRPEDGTAVEHLDTAGWVYDLVRVR